MSAVLTGRHFTLSRVLGRTGIALRRIWLVFLLVTILIGLPELTIFAVIDDHFRRDTLESLLIGSFGIALLDGIGMGWLTAAVLAAATGPSVPLVSTLRRAVRVWAILVPVIGVNNLSWNVFFVQSDYWRVGIGLVAALVVAVALWVYVPVVVAERHGIWTGLRRGLFLVAGNGWRIGILMVLYLLISVASTYIAWSVAPLGLNADCSLGYGGNLSLAGLLNSLINELAAVLATASYILLRNDKDGVPVEDVAPVFD